MPNWCQQNLVVVGPADDLTALKTAVFDGSERGDLNHLVPVPAELANTVAGFFGDPEEQAKQAATEQANMEKYGFKDWYDWCVENWGTKWGACDVDMDTESIHGPEYWSGHFQSAWCPAEGLIKSISAQYPNLVFGISFIEESDAFAGWTVWRAGKTLAEVSYEPQVPAGDWDSPEFDEEAHYEQLCDIRNTISEHCHDSMVKLVEGFYKTRKVYSETGG